MSEFSEGSSYAVTHADVLGNDAMKKARVESGQKWNQLMNEGKPEDAARVLENAMASYFNKGEIENQLETKLEEYAHDVPAEQKAFVTRLARMALTDAHSNNGELMYKEISDPEFEMAINAARAEYAKRESKAKADRPVASL